ncbi:MAG: AlpA family phage regulatory protein [Proteobacteria bacterium]|nr:AlpA family phage regulatory protein [Pseudomonadota bacterium]
MTTTNPHIDVSISALPVPVYYRMRDVIHITGLSRPTLYRRIAAQRFPAPMHLGGRACGWHSSVLQRWISDPNGYRAQPATTTYA